MPDATDPRLLAKRNDRFRREIVLLTISDWMHQAANGSEWHRWHGARDHLRLTPEVAALNAANKLAVLDRVRNTLDFATVDHSYGTFALHDCYYAWNISDEPADTPTTDPL